MKKKNLTFVNLALALANDYTSLFVIDSQNDSYVEYAVNGIDKELLPVSKGENFYQDVHKNCREQVWPEDQEYFLNTFRKENVQQALKDGKSFSLTYRLTIDGKPRYFYLKTIQGTDSTIVIGVQDIDTQKRKEIETEKEKRTYSEIAEALASRYEVIYYINADTNEYTQYSASKQYANLGTNKKGTDFFSDAVKDIQKYIHPEDRAYVLEKIQKSVLMQNFRQTGAITLRYRQLLEGRQQYMSMLIVQPKNQDNRIIIGVFNTDAQVRHEQMMQVQNRTFSDISNALAQRYEVIYHVNISTNEYFEYSTSSKYKKLET